MKLAAFFIDNRRKNRYNDAIDLYERCLLSKKLKHGSSDASVASLYFNLGFGHDLNRNIKHAMMCYDFAINCDKANRAIVARSLTNKANILYESNRLDEALSHFTRAICAYDPFIQRPDERGGIYLGQGQIYLKQEKVNDAMNCFEKALYIYKSSENDCDKSTAMSLQRIADLLIKSGNLEFANQCATEALEM